MTIQTIQLDISSDIYLSVITIGEIRFEGRILDNRER